MPVPAKHFSPPHGQDRSCQVWTERTVLQDGFEPHTHEMTEIVICAGGRGTHMVGERRFDMRAGDVFSINPGMVHAFSDCRSLVHWNVSFTRDMLGLCGPEIRRIPGFQILFPIATEGGSAQQALCRAHLEQAELAKVTSLLTDLLHERRRRGPGSEALQRAWFIELVVLLSRAADPSREDHDIGRAALAASWLEENHAGDVALTDLAAHCGVSVRHLTRLFQTCYQTSPISYLVRLRVEHAAGLLVHSDRSITSIAMEVGFGDSNYMARQFRQVMGCSPRAYRSRAGTA